MALAARASIVSTEMAGKGFTGIKDPLFSRHGYFVLYCQNPNPDILTKNLGKKFYADSTFKPYPSCRGTHAAIECALHLHRMHRIDCEDIAEIIVNVTPGAYNTFVGVPFEIGDVPQVNATFSIRYTVANVLLRKSIKLEHFTDHFIREPKLLDLIQRVDLKPTLPPGKPLASNVEVTMKNGQKLSAYVEVPRGDSIDNPITKEELVDKFRSNVAFSRTVPDENAEKVLGLIERLEDVHDVTEIIDALSK
jgi:2-methylcitrate dehydratase PrpD